ncbi:DUF6973 domain-containing protein [Streptomyces boninensis]|uniref:DUF6973 domain-containing protein n=1 Tax=Streptomyces boninensis TaxID=2039455 RepID=UPI003B218439
MALTYREIMAADLTPLSDTAADWRRMSKRFGELRRNYDSQVYGAVAGSQWSGLGRISYERVAKVSSAEFDHAKTQAQGIAQLMTDAYEDLMARQKALRKQTAAAEEALMKVDGDGRVSLDSAALSDSQALALRNDPGYASAVSARVTEWQEAIDKAVESVNEADRAIKAALVKAVAPPGTRVAGADGFNADKVEYIPPHSKKDLDRIMREYQVSPDPDGMVQFPRDWLMRKLVGGQEVTATEVEMLEDAGSWTRGREIAEIRETAHKEADARFYSADKNDDHNDAFRHAYGNALMASKYGEDWTTDFATAHERLPGNFQEREAMDLHNNEVGRRIAVENPDASPEELADLVEQAVRDGEMVVVREGGGGLSFSDVGHGETGEPRLRAPEDPHEPGTGDSDGTESSGDAS